MRTAYVVPLLGSIAQGVVVVTPGGLVDRPTWALAVAPFFGLLSGQLLWWRHRAPLLTAASVAVGYVVQALFAGPGLPVVIAIALYSATRWSSAENGLRLAAVGISAAAAMAAALVIDDRADLAAAYVVILLVAVVAGLLMAARDSRLLATRQTAAADERLRIARGLHDIVGHGITAITVQAGAGRVALAAGAPDDATVALSRIENAGREMLRELRWLVGVLRDEAQLPQLGDIAKLVAAVREAGLPATLQIDGDTSAASAEVGETAYRIVQEALTNALRHSGCEAVTVSLDVGRVVVIDVSDDGPDSQPATTEGNGVVGMRERAEAVGGGCRAGPSADGTGWTVHAELPVTGRAP